MNRYLPLQMICFYLIFTLVVAIFGPVMYFGFDAAGTALFMAGITVFIICGYIVGDKIQLPLPLAGVSKQINLPRIFDICLVMSLLGLAASMAILAASGGFNLDVSDVGTAYVDYYQGYERNTGNYSLDFIVYTISAAPTFITTIWGIYYFKNFSRLKRWLILAVILGTLFTFTIGSGKQKELGDIIIFSLAIIAIKAARRGGVLTPRNIFIALFVLVLGIFGFTFILSERYAAISVDAYNINRRVVDLIAFDHNSIPFRVLGNNWGLAMAMFLWYISQGYFGLSLALHSSRTWTYFIGFSYSVSVIFNQVFGVPFQYFRSYPYIAGAESGWGVSHWYSVFPWFASDVTFLGTLPLFGFFAYVYARSWIESVKFQNPISILMFCQLTLGVAFMPANNQLVHSPGPLLTTIVVSILYIWYRRAFNVVDVER